MALPLLIGITGAAYVGSEIADRINGPEVVKTAARGISSKFAIIGGVFILGGFYIAAKYKVF